MGWEGWPRLLLTCGKTKPGPLTSLTLQGDAAFCRLLSLEDSSFQNVPKWTHPLRFLGRHLEGSLVTTTWQTGNKMEWERDTLVQQLKSRDFSSGKSRWHNRIHANTSPSSCARVCSHINQRMLRALFSFPGCASRGIGSTRRSAEVTSSPCPALRTSL